MKRRHPEQQLHIAVAAFLRLALRPPTIWTTIGHGGGGRVRGALLKAMGVQAGWPDILVIWPYRTGPGSRDIDPQVLGIELKSAKGRLSPEQKAVRDAFDATRAAHATAYSVEQVETILRQFHVPIHASVLGLQTDRRAA